MPPLDQSHRYRPYSDCFIYLFCHRVQCRANSRSYQCVHLKIAEAKAPALSGPVSYSSAVKAAAPAVVNINTEKVITVGSHPFFSDPSV